MALSIPSLLLASPSPSSCSVRASQNSTQREITGGNRRRITHRVFTTAAAAASKNVDVPPPKVPKLVTFLGKGGSGKTTSAVFAAQHYAMAGLKTCLVVHSQDPTADYLLNFKIGTSPTTCNNNLSAVRLETTKVVGEELGVLPGMDSIFSALALERLVGFYGNVAQKNRQKDKFDVIVYDGLGTEETIRLIGATSKARLYLKYLRNLAERTDLGRLAGPSLLRLVEDAISLSGRDSPLNGKMSAEIWDNLEQTLKRGSSVFEETSRFGCYLVMDPNSPTSVNSALRFWGCAIQAGAKVSGAFGVASPNSSGESIGTVKKKFSPLPCSLIPHLSVIPSPDWNEILLNETSAHAKELLSLNTRHNIAVVPSVRFDPANKSVTLFMPGFDKSEIKLYQVIKEPNEDNLVSLIDHGQEWQNKFRGGSELLVEAGDQRRVIHLPSQIQGKVGGAKFTERSLVITMR
ncbi:hypothetical protein RHMOL_Rhmol09G0165400 [Rhododendron molle]|uniref:Uncharacterized protein n=1 Tax=Rhododendron molle TaxID=49168 RepID=A0ACC0ME31_RHOML|nr:hypothetical protein RHMOL_Rhmol09G0165400 [Rhododendron molle]